MKDIKYEVTSCDCWEVVSHATDSNGYPRLSRNGNQYRAHQYIYEQYVGPIKEGMVIRHKCDNRKCINPEHLEIGTHSDNVADRVKRNRSAVGVNNGRAKLTEEDVKEIFIDNDTPKMHLARFFRVDPKVIRDIKQRKIWKHVTI